MTRRERRRRRLVDAMQADVAMLHRIIRGPTMTRKRNWPAIVEGLIFLVAVAACVLAVLFGGTGR